MVTLITGFASLSLYVTACSTCRSIVKHHDLAEAGWVRILCLLIINCDYLISNYANLCILNCYTITLINYVLLPPMCNLDSRQLCIIIIAISLILKHEI